MKVLTKERKQELAVYLAVWAGAFAIAALFSIARGSNSAAPEPWMHSVLHTWGKMLPFLLLFAVHEAVAAPLLRLKGRKWAYAAVTALLLAAFGAYIFTSRPMMDRGDGPQREMPGREAPQRDKPERFRPEPGRGAVPPAAEGHPHPDGRGKPDGRRRPLTMELMEVLLGALMVGASLGLKAYIKSLSDAQRLKELEKENLSQQLEYLRYQINPHFFMNTLNNIHALVDLDPERAKESIVELSKLMRYILYEGSKPTIPLEKETDFLKQYISLMKMRYADSVRITSSLPENVSGASIPPLLLVTFVENAFKHGISYEADSFVDVDMEVSGGRLRFRCANSKNLTNQDPHSGIGMQNVRKRLGLLYGGGYTLDIEEGGGAYRISLDIPVSNSAENNSE